MQTVTADKIRSLLTVYLNDAKGELYGGLIR